MLMVGGSACLFLGPLAFLQTHFLLFFAQQGQRLFVSCLSLRIFHTISPSPFTCSSAVYSFLVLEAHLDPLPIHLLGHLTLTSPKAGSWVR